jgi:hypothetical protein
LQQFQVFPAFLLDLFDRSGLFDLSVPFDLSVLFDL